MTKEFDIETLSEPLTPAEDRSLDNGTPICQVQPLLGTTHRENLQLQNKNTLEDTADILEMTAFQGYVNTPLQTLDGILVQKLKDSYLWLKRLNVWWKKYILKN